MTKNQPHVRKHYLEYRLVWIHGAVYIFTLTIASVLFYRMMTSKFFHPLFWSWTIWTFVTAYWFYIFMRSALGPAVQIYPEEVVLSHPKRRYIPKKNIQRLEVSDSCVDLTFEEDSEAVTLKIPIRKSDNIF